MVINCGKNNIMAEGPLSLGEMQSRKHEEPKFIPKQNHIHNMIGTNQGSAAKLRIFCLQTEAKHVMSERQKAQSWYFAAIGRQSW